MDREWGEMGEVMGVWKRMDSFCEMERGSNAMGWRGRMRVK